MRYTTSTPVRIDVIFSYLCTLLIQPLTQLCQECVAIYLSPYDTHRNDLYYHPCIKAFTIHTTICAWVLHKSQITFNQSVQRKTANSVDLKRFQLHIAEFSLVVTTVQRNSPSTKGIFLEENSPTLLAYQIGTHLTFYSWLNCSN